jgi:hypothetical protein
MKQLTASQITTLSTSKNALGSFEGQLLSNLQQDDLEPGEYTIQFQIVEPVIDGLGSATYAYIFWKVDGQHVQRIISVFSGSVISGVANSAHVQLLDQSDRGAVNFDGTFNVTNGSTTVTATQPQTFSRDETLFFSSQPGVSYNLPIGIVSATTFELSAPYNGPTTPAAKAFGVSSYKVAVALSKGTRATTMQPPVLLTQNSQVVNAGGFVLIPFPIDAGIISVLATVTVPPLVLPAAAANGVLIFFDANSNTLAAIIPANFPGWYPIPPGSIKIEFFNLSTTDTLHFSFQWGVEG